VRPAEPDRFVGRGAREESVEEPAREPVAAAHPVEDVELAGRAVYARPETQATALQRWRLADCTARSVVAIALTCGYRTTTSSIIDRKALGSRACSVPAAGPGIPSPRCRSSSFPTSTSTCSTIRPMTWAALVGLPQTPHRRSRKFRSKEVTAPAALAAFIPSTMSAPVDAEREAKMPPLWNHRTPPAKMALQSKSPGLSCAAASLARL